MQHEELVKDGKAHTEVSGSSFVLKFKKNKTRSTRKTNFMVFKTLITLAPLSP